MAVGNLIGSSVYNVVFILGLTIVVAPDAIPVPAEVLYVDMLVMAAVSLLVVLLFRTGRRITRKEGMCGSHAGPQEIRQVRRVHSSRPARCPPCA